MENGRSTIRSSGRWFKRTQKKLDKTGLRPMGDHVDMFQHVYREWNQEAGRLMHVAREEGTTWNSYVMEKGARVEAVGSFFDGGVSSECNAQIKNKVDSAFVIQFAERIEEEIYQIKWRIIVEFEKILADDATVTHAECTAAVEAARAICCLARAGCICFDLDGKLTEDHNNKTRKRNEMKADSEGRWKKKEEISRPSHSLSSSFLSRHL